MILAPISVTASTLTITKKGHANATLVANRAAGITMTLPAAVGSGAKFRCIVGTTVTSNNLIIKVANSTDVMAGTSIVGQDGADTANIFETAADSDTITMNGSTKGGILGDIIEIEDYASGKFFVRIIGSATGTEATPFSAAV